MGGTASHVARWLGEIHEYFPSSMVQVMQEDVFERQGLREMLCEPEMLAAVEPDAHLLATLPSKTRATPHTVVAKLVELERKPRQRGAPVGHGHSLFGLHAGPVPRPDGGRDPAS